MGCQHWDWLVRRLGSQSGKGDDALVIGSPFLYIVFSVWRVTFLRWVEGGWPIGEWEELRIGAKRLLSALVSGDAVVSSGDEAHLSHSGGGGDNDDHVDNVRIELCAVRRMVRDITISLWREEADFWISWWTVERSARIRCKK